MGGQLLRGPEKGCWEVEVVSCVVIHILQTHISVPGQKSDTFSHESWGGVWICLTPFSPFLTVSVPCCPGAQLSPLELPAFSEAHFTDYVLVYCEAPTWRGRVLILAIRVIATLEAPVLTQGQKQAGETHDPGPLGTEPEWNPENLKHRNKLREWWMVTRKEPREYFCHFNLHKHLFITYPEINHVLGSEYYLLSIYKKDLCHLNSF